MNGIMASFPFAGTDLGAMVALGSDAVTDISQMARDGGTRRERKSLAASKPLALT